MKKLRIPKKCKKEMRGRNPGQAPSQSSKPSKVLEINALEKIKNSLALGPMVAPTTRVRGGHPLLGGEAARYGNICPISVFKVRENMFMRALLSL